MRYDVTMHMISKCTDSAWRLVFNWLQLYLLVYARLITENSKFFTTNFFVFDYTIWYSLDTTLRPVALKSETVNWWNYLHLCDVANSRNDLQHRRVKCSLVKLYLMIPWFRLLPFPRRTCVSIWNQAWMLFQSSQHNRNFKVNCVTVWRLTWETDIHKF